MNNLSYLVPIIVALVTVLGGYLTIVRKASGRIATTEASKLWDEATSMRKAYVDEIARLHIETAECRAEIANVRKRVENIETENQHLEDKNKELERKIYVLQRENESLRKQNAMQQQRIEELEQNA